MPGRVPRALITCQGRDRRCGARLQIELASGAGLGSQEACPRCGDTKSARFVLVQARQRFPNRVWVVQAIREAAPEAAAQAAAPAAR